MRRGLVLVCALAVTACSESQAPTDSGLRIQTIDSAPLKGTPYDTIPVDLAVRVTDGAGRPVAGIPLTWTTPDGGTFLPRPKYFVTDSAGIGRARWIMGPAIGTQRASAALVAGTAAPAAFSAEADALRAVSLSLGEGLHRCAIDSQGAIWCWSRGIRVILGDGGVTADITPVRVALNIPAVQVVTASDPITCALTIDGDVYCWGGGSHGQLGNGTTPSALSTAPVKVSLPAGRYKQLSANQLGVCAVSTTGDAYCWGMDVVGRFGNGQSTYGPYHDTPTPTLVAGGFSWQQLSLGDDKTCGVRTDRTVYCWGWNTTQYPLGIDADTSVSTPEPVITGFHMDSVTVSGLHQCGVTLLHETYCWGANANLAIPFAPPALRSPAQLPPTPALQAVHSIYKPTFARGVDGKGYWWGPPMGASGGGPNSPTLFSGRIPLRAIGTGNTDVCGIAADTGAVYCWTEFTWDGPRTVYAVRAPS
jgi:hypothetical protein